MNAFMATHWSDSLQDVADPINDGWEKNLSAEVSAF